LNRKEQSMNTLVKATRIGMLTVALLAATSALADDAPAADLPAFLKAGTRITYHAGDSVVQGVGSHLVEKENGGWIDPRTGKTFADDQLRSSGGVGYHELNVVHAARDLIAADIRNFQIVDVARGTASAASVGGVTGNAEKLGDYWVHPARLAAIPDERGDGRRVNRVEYPLNGRTHKAISIADTTERSYARTVYDLDTGLLLSRATSTTADNVKTIDPQTGKVGAGRGAAAISHMLLVSVRDLKIPWAAEPAPEWATKGRRLDYQGGYALVAGPGLPPLPPYAMTLSFGFENVEQGVVTAKQLTRSDIGRGLPAQETTSDRCFSSAMFGGAWIGPAALRGLAPNTVIDEDPVTKFRTTYAGVQNNVAVFVVQGPLETSQVGYDPQNGMLVGIVLTKTAGTGQTVTRLQLSGTR
jgi:hypothetical protein